MVVHGEVVIVDQVMMTMMIWGLRIHQIQTQKQKQVDNMVMEMMDRRMWNGMIDFDNVYLLSLIHISEPTRPY